MQLMIDISNETPQALRLAAKFLSDHADIIESISGAPDTGLPAGLHAQPVGGAPPPFVPPPPPVAVAPAVPTLTPPAVPVPPPPAAPSPVTAMPSTSIAAPTATIVAPPAPIAPTVAIPDALDSSGMPWDARIHQKGKSQKKDGTWKVQKGIDPAIVSAVTQELHARMINSTASGPPTNAAVVPPPPAQVDPQPPPVPVPPPPHVGVPNAPGSVMVPAAGGFRELVAKIGAARTAGRITPEQVTAIVMQAGAPSLQMLGSMAHLVPVVDSLLDAHLAMN